MAAALHQGEEGPDPAGIHKLQPCRFDLQKLANLNISGLDYLQAHQYARDILKAANAYEYRKVLGRIVQVSIRFVMMR